MTLLSIIVPTLEERRELRKRHIDNLYQQIKDKDVELNLYEDNGTEPYANKMNRAMLEANGDYVCTVDDDDDRVSGNYVDSLLKSIDKKPDVITFKLLKVDIAQVWDFHTTYHDRFPISEDTIGMTPNHLCCWKREIARSVEWPLGMGQCADVVWYTRLMDKHKSLDEIHIPNILYLYFFDPLVTRCQQVGK